VLFLRCFLSIFLFFFVFFCLIHVFFLFFFLTRNESFLMIFANLGTVFEVF
jgi:hypothetical protein